MTTFWLLPCVIVDRLRSRRGPHTMLGDVCTRFIGGFHGLSRWPGDWTPVGTRATRVSAGTLDIFAHRDFEGSPTRPLAPG